MSDEQIPKGWEQIKKDLEAEGLLFPPKPPVPKSLKERIWEKVQARLRRRRK